MTSITTFYFSHAVASKLYDLDGNSQGKVLDVLVRLFPVRPGEDESIRPQVVGFKIKSGKEIRIVSFSVLKVTNLINKCHFEAENIRDTSFERSNDIMFLGQTILDKQIVDLNGRKLVRVNDIRLVAFANSAFAIAVDVGIEGLLRRLGVARLSKKIVSLFGAKVPSKFILWDDVEAIDFSNLKITLSKTFSKLHTLHPSDLADIIEDLGKANKTKVFSALDEEKAADVLEELEPHEQVHIIESLPLEKAADVLEKMPANEAADIIDELEDTKAEQLLQEMEQESSADVREILEYPDGTVGSIMSTEILSFPENISVAEVFQNLRERKPEMEELYNIFVTDEQEKLVATISLRDLIISEPEKRLSEIMETDPINVLDDDPISSLAEVISKYNLLAMPVTDSESKLVGMVVIDDIIEDLIDKGLTK